MGWNVRRSRQIVPGVRLNFSKRGLGLSVGPKHAKISVSPGRRVTTNIGIPGTGIRYTKVASAKQQSRVNQKISNGDSYQIDGVDHVEIYKPGSISSYLMAFSVFGGIFAAIRPKIAIKVGPNH